MKKRFIWLFVIIISIINLGACNASSDPVADSEKEDSVNTEAYELYTAYISASGVEGTDGRIEVSKKFRYLMEADIPNPTKNTIKLDVLGKSRDAVFSRVKVWAVFTPAYIYSTPEGDEITVDSSGKLISFTSSESSSNFIEYVDQEKALTPEESLAKGTEYLIDLFGEELAAEYSAKLPDTSLTVVRIRFLRKNTDFGKYSIDDKIIIELDEEGNLLGYELYNVGAYENKKIPDDFNDDKIKEIINKSLIDNKSDIEISEQRNLVILPDEKMACSTCFRLKDGDSVGEWTSVLIPLE